MRSTAILFTLATALPGPLLAQSLNLATHWRFDETSGAVAKDSSANGNDGSLLNFPVNPWVTGKFNNALQFDGIDDYVNVGIKGRLPVFAGYGAPYSITFWVKGAAGQNDKRVYSEGSSSNNNPLFTLGTGRTSDQTSDRLQVFFRDVNGQNIVNDRSSTVVFDNKWHHVAWVDVAGEATLYIDGKVDGANWDYRFRGPQTRRFGAFPTNVVSLGAVLRASPCCYFAGELDDFRIYHSALAAGDVTIVMAGGPHPPCRGSVGKFGVGCGAGPLDIHALGTGQLGSKLLLRLHRGRPGAPALLLLGGPIAPTDLTPIGLRDCKVYPPLAGVQFFGMGATDATGTSPALPLTFPTDPGLTCVLIALQGMTAGVLLQDLELSSAVVVQLGN